MITTGIYGGSFDPITAGHIDIIRRASVSCDNLIIGIGVHPSKKPLFSGEERLDLIKRCVPSRIGDCFIEAVIFEGMLVDFAKKHNASFLIRGIRSVSDFEYEINLANINRVFDIETVFWPTNPQLAIVSSSAAKELAKYHKDLSKFVPNLVAEKLQEKFKELSTKAF